MMFLGYAPDWSPGTYRFLNLTTLHVVMSRDVVWLGNLYKDRLEVDESEMIIEDDVVEEYGVL